MKPSRILLVVVIANLDRLFFWENPFREGKRQMSSISAIIIKRIRDGVIEENQNAIKNRNRKASWIDDIVPFELY